MRKKQKINLNKSRYSSGKKIRSIVLLPVFLLLFFLCWQVDTTNAAGTWQYQGVAFYAYKNQFSGTIPVYRFRHKENRDHVYTISSKEKNNLIANPQSGWSYQGVAFYTYKNQFSGTIPVYRFRHKENRDHVYTISENEKAMLEALTVGPRITVGLWNYTRSESRDTSIRIEANVRYAIRESNGSLVATVDADSLTRVKYNGDGNLRVYNSIPETIIDGEVYFEAANGRDRNGIIFNAHRPDSSFDKYRTKIKVRYSDTTKKIWIINELPLEYYTWGDGEFTGTGDMDYNRVMATAFRTYGYWKILYSIAYATEGFKVNATPGNQLYYGYEWEESHPRIKRAARDTAGYMVFYDGEVALTPYSSWTDGKTRSFEERWGSDNYPYCQSVSDPWGKHPSKGTSQLVSEGNHMVGISAHGALSLAGDHGWSWGKILRHYYTNITLSKRY